MRLLEELQGLLQVDDVDTAPLGEDEAAHLWIPASRLVAEVDSSLQKLAHRDDGHRDQVPFLVVCWYCRRGLAGTGIRQRAGTTNQERSTGSGYEAAILASGARACALAPHWHGASRGTCASCTLAHFRTWAGCDRPRASALRLRRTRESGLRLDRLRPDLTSGPRCERGSRGYTWRALASASASSGGIGDSTSTRSPVNGCANARRAACRN